MAQLSKTFQLYINALDNYDEERLLAKPSEKGWSIGQVYMHIISETNFYLSQIRLCSSNNDNSSEQASDIAMAMLKANALPDELIEGPPSNALVGQPHNKAQLAELLQALNEEITANRILLEKTSFKGKTKHPGLNYFDAKQWYQFAEMHLRHHLRQKERIDAFLNSISFGE
jgi:hypothetical protein